MIVDREYMVMVREVHKLQLKKPANCLHQKL